MYSKRSAWLIAWQVRSDLRSDTLCVVDEAIPDGLGITVEMWEQTPSPIRAILCAFVLNVSRLEARVADLETRLGKNSKNSSKPPSTDPPNIKHAKRNPSGKKQGAQPGQPGHPGQTRMMLAVNEVNVVVKHFR